MKDGWLRVVNLWIYCTEISRGVVAVTPGETELKKNTLLSSALYVYKVNINPRGTSRRGQAPATVHGMFSTLLKTAKKTTKT